MTALDRRDLPLKPPPPAEAFTRVDVLDVLRGAALVGALVVNLAVFSADGGSPGARNRAEWWVATIREVLTDGKWYPVFAFLFGYSLALQLRSPLPLAERRRRLTRRLVLLGAIGVAHGLLLYRWDILFAYSVLGAVVYRERRRTTRTLFVWSMALLLFGAWLATEPSIYPERYGFTRVSGAPAVQVYAHGTLGDVIRLHWHNHPYNLVNEIFAQWPWVLAMMFLGVLAERHLLLTIAESLEHRVRIVATTLGAASLAWNVISETTSLDGDNRPMAIIGTLTIVVQAIGAIAWLSRTDRLTPTRRALATLGRLSLTNYLVQSVICTTLAFGYGFGLGPRLDPITQTFVCALIIGAQIVFSHWWLQHHERGPVESVVARWTRATMPTLRLRRQRPA